MYIMHSACQFKQVWCWDVDQMLYFTFKKQKMLKRPGLCPGPRWGAHSAPLDPRAGFEPILCLVVFFIGPNCMLIWLSPHF